MINYQLLFLFVVRFVSIIPLLIMFLSISKTYLDKRHYINGLRKTRVILMILFFTLIIDNIIFCYSNLLGAVSGNSHPVVNIFLTTIDRLILAMSFFLMYYLFQHASKKDSTDSVDTQNIKHINDVVSENNVAIKEIKKEVLK